MSGNERFCILLVKNVGKKKEKGLIKSGTTKVDVLPGTLLILLEVVQLTTNSPLSYVLETVDSENVEVKCSLLQDFEHIPQEVFHLIASVPTCQERLTIYQHKEWLNEGLSLVIGDYFDVWMKGHQEDLQGILRWRGLIPGVNGIMFGIEFLNDPGQGTCDGVFRNERYFSCPPESAVFVGIHRIRKSKTYPLNCRRKRTPEGAEGTNYSQRGDVMEKGGLVVGTRIVWMSDLGPECGMVKWIGMLPDARPGDDVTVGVEFDNAVGSGTGKYKEVRLFQANQGHASLVPILGLLREEEIFPERKKDNFPVSHDLSAFTDMGSGGKTSQDVIDEQKRLMAEANQNLPQRTSDCLKIVELNYGDNYTIPNKNIAFQTREPMEPRGMNPLYEYNKSEAVPDRHGQIRDDILPHGGQGPPRPSRKNPTPDPDLEVESLVQVMHSQPLYGTIKWIGYLPDQKEPKKRIAGLEMDEEISAGTDGTFGQHRLFFCPPRKGFFVPLYKCRKDKRFADNARLSRTTNFGSIETPDLAGTVSPPDSLDDISVLCGKNKGIQGHHNSCYLDASLLAMFYFSTVFDSILYRDRDDKDLPEYDDVKKVLKEGIVNPLRQFHYVRADKVMKLRQLLDKLGNISGMMNEEKDPEEFLNLLLNEITKAEPFLHISSGDNQETQRTFFYQLIMEKDERLVLPTTQQLFELSFLQMGIKLQEIPSCLIMQMPRFGKDYKMYRRILPSLELDITDVLENAPRECIICGDLAVFECQACYQVHGAGLNTIAFCEGCKRTSHQHKQRIGHQPKQIHVPQGFHEFYSQRKATTGQQAIPREKMELFAVICIQTSHYVSFVKGGKGKHAEWIFFDSMADRKGEVSGYNIPEVTQCPDLPKWLSDEGYANVVKSPDDKQLPEHMRRLFCDAYICMYQSTDVMMFK